jgi:5-methylthioadenosine/S-adenosylhomocysteine deaminase
MCHLCRRNFIRGFAAFGAASAIPSPLLAQGAQKGAQNAERVQRPPADITPRLPPRGEFIFRNAHVMTMDSTLGDIPGGSVHVRNGEIVAVGRDVDAPGAQVIAGDDMIVLPGLVETHWHMWNTLFRSFSGDEQADGYFPTVARYGANMTPDDMYQGTRLAAAEALNAGMTTVHDWCHNIRTREYAERDLAALAEAGLRARFSYGWAQGQDDKDILNISDIEALHGNWKNYSNEGLITLGVGWRGMFRAGPLPENVYRAEFEAARAMGIPLTVHIASRKTPPNQIEAHAKAKLIGKDVQLVHAVWATADEIAMIKEAGASISLATPSDMRIGFGLPPVSEFLAAAIPCGVSVDTSALIGNSSLFGVLRDVRDAENARTLSEFKLTARRVLELGTIEGARSLGIDDKVGSLKPGKRADIIMVTTRALNMGGFADAAHLLVGSALPENVDTVVVDGRILKERGKLTALSASQVAASARSALEAVRKRTNWR